MKRTKTPIPPLFEGKGTPNGHWSWTVTMKLAPSGYCQSMHVIAMRSQPGGVIAGSAEGDVPPFVDTHEVMELLALEAMLAAEEPTLWEERPHRYIDVSTSL